MVSSLPPTSMISGSSIPDLSSINSSLKGSSANSTRASSIESTTRREKRCDPLMICFIRFSSLARSSGVNGRSTAKS